MGNSPHLGLSVLVLLEVGNAPASQLFAAALGAGSNFPMPRGDDGPNADHQIHQQNQRNDRIGAPVPSERAMQIMGTLAISS